MGLKRLNEANAERLRVKMARKSLRDLMDVTITGKRTKRVELIRRKQVDAVT